MVGVKFFNLSYFHSYIGALSSVKIMRSVLVSVLLFFSLSASAFTHKSFTVDFTSNQVIFSGQTFELIELKVVPKFQSRVIEYRTIDSDNKMVIFYIEQFDNGALKLTAERFKN